MSTDTPEVRQLWPLLFVRDLSRSSRFYTSVLGFTVVGKADSAGDLFWCRLRRGGACFMLQQMDGEREIPTPAAPGVGFHFVCDDVDALLAEFSERGLTLDPRSVAYYGMRQVFVPDPDGYTVCFESPTEDWSG